MFPRLPLREVGEFRDAPRRQNRNGRRMQRCTCPFARRPMQSRRRLASCEPTTLTLTPTHTLSLPPHHERRIENLHGTIVCVRVGLPPSLARRRYFYSQPTDTAPNRTPLCPAPLFRDRFLTATTSTNIATARVWPGTISKSPGQVSAAAQRRSGRLLLVRSPTFWGERIYCSWHRETFWYPYSGICISEGGGRA